MYVASFENLKVLVKNLIMSYKSADYFLEEPCCSKIKFPSYLILNYPSFCICKPWCHRYIFCTIMQYFPFRIHICNFLFLLVKTLWFSCKVTANMGVTNAGKRQWNFCSMQMYSKPFLSLKFELDIMRKSYLLLSWYCNIDIIANQDILFSKFCLNFNQKLGRKRVVEVKGGPSQHCLPI